MSQKSDITLYFLNASRAIRIAWLLEELKLPYNVVASDRAPNGLAPPEFKKKIPGALGKSPTIKNGDFVLQESGAIVEYICEQYDTSSVLIPKDAHVRARVREWISAAEGTFMVHCLALLYARWRIPKPAASHLPEMEEALSPNIHNDLNWLDSSLASTGKYLVGNNLTAADIMVHFAVQFIYAKHLGVDEVGTAKGKKWENVERWLKAMEQEPGYKKAVEKCGYVL